MDVDDGLPLPEVGQASTVFSLTALFGAYLGIHLLLGIPALVGVACGCVVGLLTIRYWILKHRSNTFEEFLNRIVGGGSGNAAIFALSLSIVQCGYAASELLILREISRMFLGLRSEFATLFAVVIGIVGYFYVLFGGYLAVYRTDILQAGLVGVMAFCFAIYAVLLGPTGDVHLNVWPRSGYWELPIVAPASSLYKYIYQFLVGAIMGFGLLAAAPDAWKRVFVVTTRRNNNLPRFGIFILAGIAPFAALLPIALSVPSLPDGPINVANFFARFTTNDYLFVAGSLGLVACFLSSFNSALLASIHVMLIMQRKRKHQGLEISRFHNLTAWMLIAIFFLFAMLQSSGNPYLLANLLLGPYALVAGLQAGTNARPALLPENAVLWIVVAGFTVWFAYLVSTAGIPSAPTTFQVNTVPSAAALFLIVSLASKIMTRVQR